MPEPDRPMSSTHGLPSSWQPRHWRSTGGMEAGAAGRQPAASITDIDAALQRNGWRLTFPAALERAYHRETGVARLTRVVSCNVVGALMTLANTVRDASTVPELGHILSPLRWGTAAFIITAAAVMYWRRRQVPAWLLETVTSIGSSLVAVYVLIAAQYPIEDMSVLIKMGGMFLLFMHAGLAARQQFRHTLGQGLLMLLGYALLARSHSENQAIVVSGNLLLLATTLAFSLVANHVLESRERRAYLLRALETHQRQQLAEKMQALRELSLTDGLTGLANRRHFEAELQAAWRIATPDAPLALLQIDVDFFKRYNDHYGHPAGDACLQQVARALLGVAARRGGLAARTGGEEFALLLPAHALDAAAQAGEALREDVRALGLPHANSAVASCVTISIGAVAASPEATFGTRELIQAADQALYAAKGSGRDRLVCSSLADASAQAIARPQCVPDPQPQADAPIDADLGEHAQASALLIQRLDALTAELQRKRLRWLRFGPALEAAFVQARDAPRAVLLSTIGVLGALFCFTYVWLSQPLFADVAQHTVRSLAWVTGVVVLIGASLRLRMPPGRREALFAASAVGLAVSVVVLVAPSQKITVYSYALSLFLVPTFIAIVAAQPFRLSLFASVLIWGAMVIGLKPRSAGADVVWIESSLLVFDGIAFALVGGYLLELSTRRDYLLKTLAAAQRELLGCYAERLAGLAATDPLTGLANRRSFDAQHAELWAMCAAAGQPLALLIVDIDHFKRYNDSQGHPAGDRCLKRVAHALAAYEPEPRSHGRTTPVHRVARLGGEEFGVLLPGHELTAALRFGRSLCACVGGLHIDHPDSPTAASVTVSIGAASVRPSPGTAAGSLLHGADAALYQAKARGRNRAEGASPGVVSPAHLDCGAAAEAEPARKAITGFDRLLDGGAGAIH